MQKPTAVSEQVPPPLIGSYVLESLTTGMYGERRNAIREYIQNAYDSIVSARQQKVLKTSEGEVTLRLDAENRSLVITDTGLGVPARIAVNTLTAIGASRKQRGKEAGFRGIGRLAGIAFSSTLVFITKAAGESKQTQITIDCEKLRSGMLNSSSTPAAALMTECTSWIQSQSVRKVSEHWFEVQLLGLIDAPAEATDPLQLYTFLSQVAPVDFHPEFPFRNQLRALLEKKANDKGVEELPNQIPLEFVNVYISTTAKTVEQVFKPFRKVYSVGDANGVELSQISLHVGTATKNWWGWIGHKDQPGAYRDSAIAGIRVRVKNIQIDGSDLIRDVPVLNDQRTEFDLRSTWFIGEVHVNPKAVVPNARRDGFEDDKAWLAIREEIATICDGLVKEAHKISKAHQLTVGVIEKKVKNLQEDYVKAVRAKKSNVQTLRKLLTTADQLQKTIEKAVAGSATSEVVSLKSLSKTVTQIKSQLLAQPQSADFSKFRKSLLAEFLDRTLEILRDVLELEDYQAASNALRKKLR